MPSKKLQVPGVGIETDHDTGSVTVSGAIPKRPEWCFEASYERQPGGGLVLARLEVFSCHYEVVNGQRRVLSIPIGGLTTAIVRSVPVAALLDDLATYAFASDGRSIVEWTTGVPMREFRSRPRPGRAGRDDRHYAELAALYVEIAGTSRRPVADLAERTNFDPITVRDKLAEARRRGLLESAGRGRSGGRLTTKATDLLTEVDR